MESSENHDNNRKGLGLCPGKKSHIDQHEHSLGLCNRFAEHSFYCTFHH